MPKVGDAIRMRSPVSTKSRKSEGAFHVSFSSLIAYHNKENSMSVTLLILGLILVVIGGFWLLVVTFQESFLWGIGSLVFPVMSLIFVVLNWDICKSPFLLQVFGLVIAILGILMAEPSTQVAHVR
jgi:hypothetical protein